jgi:hypothetical protein
MLDIGPLCDPDVEAVIALWGRLLAKWLDGRAPTP